MTATDATTTHNLERARLLLEQCWDPPRPEAFGTFTTSERAVAVFSAVAASFPDARLQVAWTVADDRRVAMGARMIATHGGPWRDVAATGRPVDVACTITLSFDDGVVVDTATVVDTLALAEQIGAVAPLGPPACRRLAAGGAAT